MFYDPQAIRSLVQQDAANAVAYIQEHGFCKFTIEDFSGAVCLAGALHRVKARQETWDAVRSAIPINRADACYGDIADWNDRPLTTVEDVIALLQRL